MKRLMNDCELDSLFAAWSDDRRSPAPRPLKEWIARYPHCADDLVRWAADAPILDTADMLADDAAADTRALVLGRQVMENLRARLAPPTVAVRPLVSLKEAAAAVGLNLKTLAERLGFGQPVLMKLEYRHLRVASLPSALITQIADTLQVTGEQVRAYLQQSPTLAPGASYKNSNGVPQVAAQEEFAQAIRACPGMTDDQKNRWLSAE